ncbi:MAG: asparagine synthase (glutamine-hydrolyzing) [Thermodesulfobacteriota bacterium]|nr:asparagine synthase (glutamine-hydrolyzing) [Thermodesulfobacteriota bacterium]
MCGIAGIYSYEGGKRSEWIKRMTHSLLHRGPDDEGFLAANFESGKAYPLTGKESKVPGLRLEEFNVPVHLFLGHRRLSILDLSPSGHQPMSNEDETLWIVHNGEVYNYLEIRKELESLGHHFKSQTDTEVILHAYEEWGVDCLSRFNGMWAFAIIDLKKKRIFCSRDRAGVKPFYYLYNGKRFCFASEIKALLQIDDFYPETNEQVVADYLFSGLLDHTHETFFKNIHQLRPGEYLMAESKGLTIKSYWDIEVKEIHFPRKDDYAERFYELLEDSIRLRLRTDVPIGTCLSGGLDSSSIVCLASKLMFEGIHIDPWLVGEKQKTFSSCFEDPTYDERRFIESVIQHTKAENNYVFPSVDAFFKEMPRLLWHQEEPFGSTSIYAQWNVMRLAKERGVTVLLDGQGGDELLAGYPPSFYALFKQTVRQVALVSLIKEIRGFLKHQGQMIDQFVPRVISSLVSNVFNPLFQHLNPGGFGWIEESFKKKYYRSVTKPNRFENELNNYLYHIFRSAALPSLLHYEDRNSMAYSIETRLPFLDYRLVEFVFGLPMEFKIRGGVTKIILRKAMEGILPEEVRNRMDKMGFVTPEADWLRTTLRDPIREIFNSKSFSERGIFNIANVHRAFQDHCNGKVDNHSMIWRCVNLELWLRTFVDKNPSSQDWRSSGN